jgi:PhnB protein
MSNVPPIPAGYHTVTPNLVVDGGLAALEFYERAFGAEIVSRLESGGKLMHGEIRIGDSLISLCDPMPDYGLAAPDRDGPVSSSIGLYVEDADAVHARAVAAGASQINPVADQFHGDRAGSVRDPFGHRWSISTHIEDVSVEEMERRMAQFA